MKLDHDLHIHTSLSACCSDKQKQTPKNIIALAEEMKVHTIGFSDHVWQNPNYPPNEWYKPQDESQISKLRKALRSIETPTRVLVGCEADTVKPGIFSITPQFAETLDFVILSCNHFHIDNLVEQPESDSPKDLAKHILKFFRSGASSEFATAIVHPLMTLGYMHAFDKTIDYISDAELLDTFGVAYDNNVAIEITTGFLPNFSRFNFSIETPIRFLSLAKQAGCKFTLATDAHEPAAQRLLPELSAITNAIGLTENNILPMLRNT
jgi:histidinol phosphatase-like PHP family hydrolase